MKEGRIIVSVTVAAHTYIKEREGKKELRQKAERIPASNL